MDCAGIDRLIARFPLGEENDPPQIVFDEIFDHFEKCPNPEAHHDPELARNWGHAAQLWAIPEYMERFAEKLRRTLQKELKKIRDAQ